MRIVIDTNVLVSALLNPYGTPGQILRHVMEEEIQICFDTRILAEYLEVLRRPEFAFDALKLDDILEQIRTQGESLTTHALSVKLPDSSDLCFLEVAVAGKVDALITGNIRHYPPTQRQGIRVLLPADFLTQFSA